MLREPDSGGCSIFNFWVVEGILRLCSVVQPFNVVQKSKGSKARLKMSRSVFFFFKKNIRSCVSLELLNGASWRNTEFITTP